MTSITREIIQLAWSRLQAIAVSCIVVAQLSGEEPPLAPVKVPSVQTFKTASDPELAEVGQWVADVESATLNVDRFIALMTSEYLVTSGGMGKAVHTSHLWAEDHEKNARRWLLLKQDLLPQEPTPALDEAEAAYRLAGSVFDSSVALDQLRVNSTYHEASRYRRVTDGTDPKLLRAFKDAGHCNPIAATVSNATDIRTGNAIDVHRHWLDSRVGLRGYARVGSLTHVWWRYHGDHGVVMHRIASFRDGVPVQLQHHLGTGDDFEKVPLHSRTVSQWKQVGRLGMVPVKIRAFIYGDVRPTDMTIRVRWIVDRVPPQLFDPENVGQLSTPEAAFDPTN